MNFKSIVSIADWRLCLGCGACAYICPEKHIKLVDVINEGIRPTLSSTDCGTCRKCLDVCPAVRTEFNSTDKGDSVARNSSASKAQWGSIYEMWEGHAGDEDIRFKGASGGVLTAISAFCIEVLGMDGVLHIAQDPDDPIRNRTRLSTTRTDLVAAAGSRYSPASVCNGLGLVQSCLKSCVVIGKPSEIAGVRNACRIEPKLEEKVGVMLSFFCAESPSTGGTVALLKKLGVQPFSLKNLRYRGFGWPGHFAPTKHGESEPCVQVPYRDSWAFLQAYRPWSVQLWPDGSGELADISCGDPWYEKPDGKNLGSSLVVVRTERGRKIIEGAMAAGYLSMKRAEPWKLEQSQSGLLQKKGAVWGRRLAMRLFGLPVSNFCGLDLWHCWCQLSLGDKLRSTLGTVRRITSRKLYQSIKLNQLESVPVKAPIAPSTCSISEKANPS